LSKGVQLEYETAVTKRKPILAFIKQGDKKTAARAGRDAFVDNAVAFSSSFKALQIGVF
jgi:hypothetical protein